MTRVAAAWPGNSSGCSTGWLRDDLGGSAGHVAPRGLEGALAALKDLEARPPFSLLDLVPLNPLRSNSSNKLSRLAAGSACDPSSADAYENPVSRVPSRGIFPTNQQAAMASEVRASVELARISKKAGLATGLNCVLCKGVPAITPCGPCATYAGCSCRSRGLWNWRPDNRNRQIFGGTPKGPPGWPSASVKEPFTSNCNIGTPK